MINRRLKVLNNKNRTHHYSRKTTLLKRLTKKENKLYLVRKSNKMMSQNLRLSQSFNKNFKMKPRNHQIKLKLSNYKNKRNRQHSRLLNNLRSNRKKVQLK